MTTLPQDRRDDSGPFDLIGDVHGCYEELRSLLTLLGYDDGETPRHPDGRKVVFLGDIVDRGPDVFGVVSLVRRMIERGGAYCVRGNHDERLAFKLSGGDVRPSMSLNTTLIQLERFAAGASPQDVAEIREFLESLPPYYVLDGGKLIASHAGLPEDLQGRDDVEAIGAAVHGQNTGRIDEYGMPERVEWARAYRGGTTVVYGHTPNRYPQWINNTLCIDTGCVYGWRLTALRYPEREMVSVPALLAYARPGRPF